jgi:hypothetical protein
MKVTTYAYTPSTLETRRKIDATRWTDAWDVFDGLGRAVTHASANGEAIPWDRVDTAYNGLGEVLSRTYPYQWSTATGTGNTSAPGDAFQFDALSRPTQTAHSDGTTFLTSYAGRATETQDEGNGTARVTRISQVNGLEQLSAVCEVANAHPATEGAASAPAACGLDSGPAIPAGTGYLTT